MRTCGDSRLGCPRRRSRAAPTDTVPHCRSSILPSLPRIIRRSIALIPSAVRRTRMSLSGHVAFITGASQGIGRTCALRLAKEGAAVAVAARNQEKLNELVNEITAAGGKAAAFPLDVAEEEQVKATIKGAIAQFGKIDILVNNAGITRDQLVMRMK